jgi:hypothetical protein
MKRPFVWQRTVVGAVSLLLVSCTGSSTGADGGALPLADAGTAAGPPLSCGQIVQCVDGCSATDSACLDGCIARASSDGLAKATALAQCFQDQGCQDSACVQSSCAGELEACVGGGGLTGGPPVEPNAPTVGSVPEELVGSWSRTAWGDTDRLTLGADGKGTRFGAVVSNSKYCTTRSTDTETGAAVVKADTITIYATEVINQYKPCDGNLETVNGTPVVVELSWSRVDPRTIVVVDSRCVAKHPNDAASYCQLSLTKE